MILIVLKKTTKTVKCLTDKFWVAFTLKVRNFGTLSAERDRPKGNRGRKSKKKC